MKVKPVVLTTLILFFVLQVKIHAQPVAPGRKALIIAIGDYPDPVLNKWPRISSANDIPLIKNALTGQGFQPADISILKDAAATKAGITEAMKSLVSRVQPGDIVVIHVSAHGAQIEDDDANEEPDLLDECIVPYGARYSNNPLKFSTIRNDYYRDDELGEAVTKIRNKTGRNGHVLVILDACHSGSGTRNNGGQLRGPNNSIVSAAFGDRKITGQPGLDVITHNKSSTVLNKDAGTYISFAGARANQVNAECLGDNNSPNGTLSYAFSKALCQLKSGATYKTLFSAIQNIMEQKAPRQNPLHEGDGLDIELFGNSYIPQKPFLTIDKKSAVKDTVILAGGSLWGITNGSTIGFYEFQTTDPSGKMPIVSGKVIRTTEFSSTVVLSKPMAEMLAQQQAKAFVTLLAWGDRKLKLAVLQADGTAAQESESALVKKALTGFELVDFSPACDAYLLPSERPGGWKLYKRNSNTPFGKDIFLDNEQSVEAFKESLRLFDRVEYLKGLDIQVPALSAKVELVFLDPSGNPDISKTSSRTRNNKLELLEGDTVYLKIVNTGPEPFYFNILDIEPGGKINRIVPNSRLRTATGREDPLMIEDCMLEKNDSVLIRRVRIRITKPYGNETFKVFLTRKAISLEEILAGDDANADRTAKGALSNLEKLFINSKVNTSGKRSGSIPLNEEPASIFNYNFIIAEKEATRDR